jgi:hypothetical protein
MLFNMSLVLVYLYMQEAEKLGDLLVFLETHLPGLVNYSLDVLLLLPEEIDNYKVVIEERKRNYLMEYVRSIQVQVLVKLNEVSKQLWEKKDGVRKEIILGCFSNWVAMKYNQQLLKELTGQPRRIQSCFSSWRRQCSHTSEPFANTLRNNCWI